ncbi:aminobenzoyl-glutamate transport protein [Corynebacterium coyleae]|uniref:AbgT family transporter n=3 Tax=Corynebacteriaceae TaxID=1653 RepID=A0AAP6XK41_9CORY|nr:AbgT family transporter [Corynebacterium coyleae]QXB17775.1 AbgT family transporter [Corynebacterium coyleae]WJY79186.1 p-aminobenzoyl-glutamate transport protein [Corynebacterium coyleae]SEB70212.1 aminobenzoyl-glutamate transport protein [Corynebacterium coyleae]
MSTRKATESAELERSADSSPPQKKTAMDRLLGTIESVGNKLPEPFTLFLILFLITAVISTVMAYFGAEVAVPGEDESVKIKGFFTGEGLAWFTTTLGQNYLGFPPLVTVLPIMLAVGVSERSGMLSALIRKLFGSANRSVLPYAVGIIGVTGSIMADAAFVVIPPLAAMVFKAAGRHPVAGLLGGFAAVGAGYSTALVPTSLDALFAGITNAVMETLPSMDATEVNPVSNYYFNIAASIILGLACGFIIDRILEPRMHKLDVPQEMVEGDDGMNRDADGNEISVELTKPERRGLMWAGVATLIVTAIILFAVLIPDSPWRNEEGGFLPKSPLLQSIVFIVFTYFMVLGIVYGKVAGTVKNIKDVVDMMTKAMGDMLGFLVLAFILGQFISLFSWSGIGTFSAVKGAEMLEAAGITGFAAILAFIILASCLNLLVISGSAMWTLMAAVFVPMFALIGFEPAFTQAAFRVGDSATQIITPLNPYIIVILTLLRRYEPNAGLGTLMSRLIVFVVPFWVSWAALLFIWYIFDLPLGPGAAIFL